MFMADLLTLDTPRRTKEGFMAVRARAARVGVQDYLGAEVDPEGKHFKATDRVAVYRAEDEVFAEKSVGSFLMKPITVDHPSVPVTADNWKQFAKGAVAKAMRDGDHLNFDLVLMDADAIAAVDSGKRELSNGYACELEIGDGEAPDGTPYQARQTNISGNHVAIVDKARAGPTCRIGDAAPCDAAPREIITALFDAILADRTPRETTVKKITIDGLLVDFTDADAVAAAIEKLQKDARDAKVAQTTAETQVATLTTDKATLDAKVVTLEKQITDAKLTPAKLRDAAKAYQAVVDKAKALGVEVSDDADEAAVMKAVVDAKMGDSAKDWTPDQIATSFATLTKDVAGDAVRHDPIRMPVVANDSKDVEDAYSEMVADMQNASKPKPAQAA